MKTIRRKTGIRIAGAAVLGVLIASCAGSPFVIFRGTLYPPPFNYVPAERLRSTMWRLGASTQELDRLLREESEGGADPRNRILELLSEMEVAAASLGPGGWPSNHPRISENVDSLRDDILRAKLAVSREPPNYYFAGSVSGACLYCH